MEQLEGIVEDVVFQSDDNMYCVLRLSCPQEGRFTAVYRGGAPFVGENVQLTGQWTEHNRFGRQFNIEALIVLQPTSVAGIQRFLSSGAVKGIGPGRAKSIVDKFGTDTLEIMEKDPARLAEVRGISAKMAAAIGDAYAQLSDMRELIYFLEANGVSGGYATRLQAAYGNAAISRIKDNPYVLAEEIDGIGFRTADRIAQSLGLALEDERRIQAGLAYSLNCAAQAGHTCVPEVLLVRETTRILQIDSLLVEECCTRLINEDRLRTVSDGVQNLIYPEYLYHAEVGVTRRLLALLNLAKPITRVDAEQEIRAWEKESGIKLAAEQQEAIHTSLEQGVFVLTGGPGTGKTTVVKGIINVLEKGGCRILLAAPTGRAARRLTESSGHEAKTVHRMLEFTPTGTGYCFGKDDASPLDAEAIIVDEASMLDINLMFHLLKAVKGGCRLILVGDVDQLPSVGPGSVLKDIIRSQRVPVVRLENVFRQAEVSSIVDNAHRINRGQPPRYDKPDFQFQEFTSELEAAEFVARTCQQLAQNRSWRDFQVLSPMHKNPCGVQNLNKLLQQRLNPPIAGGQEINIPGNVLRVGDKVMQTKNNYEKGVFNGDIGQVESIFNKNLTVYYPDRPEGERVLYEGSEAEELQLAYAMSVHKSQGSEYPLVILLMVRSHYIMLQRNLLYTAVTRAKEKVLVVGSKSAVLTAVDNDKTRSRYSLLAERLQENGDLF